MRGLVFGAEICQGRWRKMVVNNRTVGKGDGCINEQTAQSKPPACVEANPGNMLNVCFMVKKKKMQLRRPLHTCSSLDEAPDHLKANQLMHVKRPAGGWDNMVFKARAHTLMHTHTPSFLLICFTPPRLHLPWHNVLLAKVHPL